MKTPEQYFEIFRDFRGMLVTKANDITMHINSIHAVCKIESLDKIHAILFAQYIYTYWNAYTMDIINGEYSYIHMTSMVWESFKEHMEK